MRYYIVDAFTTQPFGGNPAGVVLLPEGSPFPPPVLMQQIAAELRYSETAFVRREGPADFAVRYFTPCSEVDLCGHATIAVFGVLRREDVVADGAVCRCCTLAGDLAVVAGERVLMQMAAPVTGAGVVDAARLHRLMAGDRQQLWPSLPIEVVSTGLYDVMLPVRDVEQLNALHPDMNGLAEYSRELNVVGVHAFALCADRYTAHVRNFAPLYGVPEESATGTANAALTYYLFRHGLVQQGTECLFLQGEAMGRRSLVSTIVHDDGTIAVGGQCCVLASGNLEL